MRKLSGSWHYSRVFSRCTRTLLHRGSFSSTSTHPQIPYLSKNTSGSFRMNGATSTKTITRKRRTLLLDHCSYTEFRYAYSWQIEGEYNWKTFMDGYQECYHCPYVPLASDCRSVQYSYSRFYSVSHPGFAKVGRRKRGIYLRS